MGNNTVGIMGPSTNTRQKASMSTTVSEKRIKPTLSPDREIDLGLHLSAPQTALTLYTPYSTFNKTREVNARLNSFLVSPHIYFN